MNDLPRHVSAYRGVDCTGVTIGPDGSPVFAFTCDCGSAVDLHVEDLADPRAAPTLEFAFTCDGCGTAHWMTIARTGEQL